MQIKQNYYEMENGFAEFKPVGLNSSPTKEDVAQYYLNNNIVTNNDFLDNYLGLNQVKPIIKTGTPSSPTSYNIKDILNKSWSYKPKESTKINIPMDKNQITDEINSLNVSDEDKEFLSKMAKRESGYNPYITNSLGYYGLYQFGKSALDTVGMTKEDFKDTKNQHTAALKLADINERTNKDLFDKYVGTKKDGVLVTRNGLRAASALLGAKGVREWLEGGNTTWTAQHGNKDAYGTGPEQYLKLFV